MNKGKGNSTKTVALFYSRLYKAIGNVNDTVLVSVYEYLTDRLARTPSLAEVAEYIGDVDPRSIRRNLKRMFSKGFIDAQGITKKARLLMTGVKVPIFRYFLNSLGNWFNLSSAILLQHISYVMKSFEPGKVAKHLMPAAIERYLGFSQRTYYNIRKRLFKMGFTTHISAHGIAEGASYVQERVRHAKEGIPDDAIKPISPPEMPVLSKLEISEPVDCDEFGANTNKLYKEEVRNQLVKQVQRKEEMLSESELKRRREALLADLAAAEREKEEERERKREQEAAERINVLDEDGNIIPDLLVNSILKDMTRTRAANRENLEGGIRVREGLSETRRDLEFKDLTLEERAKYYAKYEKAIQENEKRNGTYRSIDEVKNQQNEEWIESLKNKYGVSSVDRPEPGFDDIVEGEASWGEEESDAPVNDNVEILEIGTDVVMDIKLRATLVEKTEAVLDRVNLNEYNRKFREYYEKIERSPIGAYDKKKVRLTKTEHFDLTEGWQRLSSRAEMGICGDDASLKALWEDSAFEQYPTRLDDFLTQFIEFVKHPSVVLKSTSGGEKSKLSVKERAARVLEEISGEQMEKDTAVAFAIVEENEAYQTEEIKDYKRSLEVMKGMRSRLEYLYNCDIKGLEKLSPQQWETLPEDWNETLREFKGMIKQCPPVKEVPNCVHVVDVLQGFLSSENKEQESDPYIPLRSVWSSGDGQWYTEDFHMKESEYLANTTFRNGVRGQYSKRNGEEVWEAFYRMDVEGGEIPEKNERVEILPLLTQMDGTEESKRMIPVRLVWPMDNVYHVEDSVMLEYDYDVNLAQGHTPYGGSWTRGRYVVRDGIRVFESVHRLDETDERMPNEGDRVDKEYRDFLEDLKSCYEELIPGALEAMNLLKSVKDGELVLYPVDESYYRIEVDEELEGGFIANFLAMSEEVERLLNSTDLVGIEHITPYRNLKGSQYFPSVGFQISRIKNGVCTQEELEEYKRELARSTEFQQMTEEMYETVGYERPQRMPVVVESPQEIIKERPPIESNPKYRKLSKWEQAKRNYEDWVNKYGKEEREGNAIINTKCRLVMMRAFPYTQLEECCEAADNFEYTAIKSGIALDQDDAANLLQLFSGDNDSRREKNRLANPMAAARLWLKDYKKQQLSFREARLS